MITRKIFAALAALATLALAPALFASEVKIEIDSNDQMQYDKKAFEVVEGQKVTLVLTHSGQLPKVAMGHNVVILKPGTSLPEFAMKCAPLAASDYIPQDEETKALIIAYTKMLGGGESDTITFTAPAAGEYPFFCSFPGHFAMMQGVMTVKAK
jgi:azurin